MFPRYPFGETPIRAFFLSTSTVAQQRKHGNFVKIYWDTKHHYPSLKLLDIPSNKTFAHFSLNCRPVPSEWTGSSQQLPGSNHAVLAVICS